VVADNRAWVIHLYHGLWESSSLSDGGVVSLLGQYDEDGGESFLSSVMTIQESLMLHESLKVSRNKSGCTLTSLVQVLHHIDEAKTTRVLRPFYDSREVIKRGELLLVDEIMFDEVCDRT
jgi:hypothetical protein